jgi:hypothetical protein
MDNQKISIFVKGKNKAVFSQRGDILILPLKRKKLADTVYFTLPIGLMKSWFCIWDDLLLLITIGGKSKNKVNSIPNITVPKKKKSS